MERVRILKGTQHTVYPLEIMRSAEYCGKKTKTTKTKNKLCKFWFTNLSAGIQQLNFWLAFLKHMAKVFILSFHIEKKILFTPRYTLPLRLKWMLESAPMQHYLHSLTNPLFYECRHKTATFLKCI